MCVASSQREVKNLKIHLDELNSVIDSNATRIRELSSDVSRYVYHSRHRLLSLSLVYSLESERDHYQREIIVLKQDVEVIREHGISRILIDRQRTHAIASLMAKVQPSSTGELASTTEMIKCMSRYHVHF